MTGDEIVHCLRSQLNEPPPLPGRGQTASRHARLWQAGVMDLSFARIAEAHWDAVAILAECGRQPKPDALYGVWASELPGHALQLRRDRDATTIDGTKMFCSGAGLVDYALVTVGFPEKLLVEVDVRGLVDSISFDTSAWVTLAFQETSTGSVTFISHPVDAQAVIEKSGWYLDRPGFWHGACGPAACWAGGADALVRYTKANQRKDAHTLAHLGAMHSSIWAMRACLDAAGDEIDANPEDYAFAHIRALTVRHIVEQNCTEILRRFARAYGPFPLSMNAEISRRYHELDLYLRQSHAERDLESLGSQLLSPK
jgi:alkylation response protein AidB-like acyl-CoA dehydrogenase